eukprot:203174_1
MSVSASAAQGMVEVLLAVEEDPTIVETDPKLSKLKAFLGRVQADLSQLPKKTFADPASPMKENTTSANPASPVSEDSTLEGYACPTGEDSEDEAALDLAMAKKGDAAGLAEQGKFAQAIELMSEALSVKPSSAMWWAFRADLYLKNAQWHHAVKDASQALERNPDSARALRVRGMAHK